jgi:prepilin-type N-terminal cleavage/methylation domain-containing protein
MTAHRPRGFTLVEIMVSLGILSVAMSAAMYLLIASNGTSRRVRIVSDAQATARLGIEALAADLRAAGLGAASGQVGVAPGAGAARRIPTIYSGPDVTIVEPGGQSVITNSLFIVTSDPASVAPGSDATGAQGVVVAASAGTPLTVVCYGSTGAAVDCSTSLVPSPLPPLIVGDFRNSVFLTPLTLGNPQGTPPTQQLDYAEKAGNAYSPDPKAPFGFVPGAFLFRARVVHWYLQQKVAGGPARLMRSFPVLSGTALTQACNTTDAPFLDETNDATGGSPAGMEMGAGPVESIQFRFVTDAGATDDPSQFSMVKSISICDVGVPATLRAVRVQVVSRTLDSDQLTNDPQKRSLYATPAFEGTAPAAASSGATLDAYPRRAFTMSVVPRNLQGARL